MEQIETLILSGRLKVGDRLASERELAEQFGVSRTAVREAVKALHQKGLVAVQPGRGTFITNGTAQVMRDSLGLMVKIGQGNIWDMLDVREILEPEIAGRAAVAATAADIAEIRKSIEIMDTSMGQDSDAWLEADLQFHLDLAKATQNIILYNLFDSITDLRREYFSHLYYVAANAELAQSQHKQILEAIIAHNPEAACQAMRTHIQHVRTESNAVESSKSG